MSKRKEAIGGPFVPLLIETIKSPAWRAMSHGARSLYVALKSRYGQTFKNNGKLFLSSRDAAIELGSNRDSIRRWFSELQHYGFIVMTNPGALGVDGKGKSGSGFRMTKNRIPAPIVTPGPNSGSTPRPNWPQ
jgi:hypothetical protein